MGRADGNIKQPLLLQSIIHEKKSEEKNVSSQKQEWVENRCLFWNKISLVVFISQKN